MKKTSITAIIIGVGSAVVATVAAVEWMPGAANTARDWNNSPVLEVIRENRAHDKNIRFAMKQYDIRTDELAEDRNVLRDRIIRLREALAQAPPSEASYRQHLEELIREAEQELQKKQRMLDQAEDNDRDILEDIHRSTA